MYSVYLHYVLSPKLSFCFFEKLQAQTITHVPLYTFTGDGNFGSSVSGAGDVNGDGKADLIVGDPASSFSDSGSAHVFSGSDGSVLYKFDGEVASNDFFGSSVSGAGDVNGDGMADLIVGVSGEDNNGLSSGNARVFSGNDGSVLYNFDGDDSFASLGESVSDAGDVNGDGRADMIVGGNGFARVFSGSNGSILYHFEGNEGDQFGFSVSGAGDVDGDGTPDLIVGAPGQLFFSSDTGDAHVFSGSDGSVLYNFGGDSVTEQFGASVSSAGDVNGDGKDDLIVGAPFDDDNGFNSGSVRVLSGSDGSVLYIFDGDGSSRLFGGSVSGVGDVNGEGKADLIIGNPNGNSNGTARVFSGSDGTILYDFDGTSLGVVGSGFGGSASFGTSVSNAGDVNGDGIEDIIVGSFGYAVVLVSQVSSPVLLGDINLDGAVNFLDISPFIAVLSVSGDQAEADTNGDGEVSFLDISPFIALLSSQ